MSAFVLIVIGGFLIGGAISLFRQPAPKAFAFLLGLAGILATVAGALRL